MVIAAHRIIFARRNIDRGDADQERLLVGHREGTSPAEQQQTEDRAEKSHGWPFPMEHDERINCSEWLTTRRVLETEGVMGVQSLIDGEGQILLQPAGR